MDTSAPVPPIESEWVHEHGHVGSIGRRTLVTGGCGLAALCLLPLLISINRALQVDEVEHLHVGYLVRKGELIYRDFREFHNPLLHLILAPITNPDDPIGTVGRARALLLVVLGANIALGAWCAWRLGGRHAAFLAAGLLLLHSTFVERGIEIRPDGPMSLCVMVALAIQLTILPERQRYLFQAVALSAAFLFTSKAAFGCFAFGCLWLASAIRHRRPSYVILPMAVWCAPLVAMLASFAFLGNLDAYLKSNVFDHARLVARTAGWQQSFGPLPFILREGIRNALFLSAGVVGIAYAFQSVRTRRRHGFVGFLGIILAASLWANPFPFPYLHVTILPTIGILAAVFLADATRQIAKKSFWGQYAAIGAFLAVAAATSMPRLLEKAQPGMEYQRRMLRTIQKVTDPDDSVFDMVGLYFRPDAYPVFVMTGNIVARYRLGGFPPIVESLRRNEAVAVMTNYRTEWLPDEDAAFIRTHFVHFDGNVFVLGTDVSGLTPDKNREFDVLKEKGFRYLGDGALLVDGEPFTQGVLTKGRHRLSTPLGITRGRLMLATPGPRPKTATPPQQMYVNFD